MAKDSCISFCKCILSAHGQKSPMEAWLPALTARAGITKSKEHTPAANLQSREETEAVPP